MIERHYISTKLHILRVYAVPLTWRLIRDMKAKVNGYIHKVVRTQVNSSFNSRTLAKFQVLFENMYLSTIQDTMLFFYFFFQNVLYYFRVELH